MNAEELRSTKSIFNNSLILNALLASSYFLFAKLGFTWGALTSNATLLWPPSGLALFALLVFGKRVVPGLLIGAIAVIQWLSPADALSNTLTHTLIGIGMAGSSIGQAWVAAHFTRHLYSRKFHVTAAQAIKFCFYILASCTIASTISNVSIWHVNIIDFSAAVQNWAVWWIGDVIGMLIIFPLLVWLYDFNTFRSNTLGNAFLIFCAGVGIVLLAISSIGHYERERNKENLLHEALNLHALLQSQLDLTSRDLDTLQDYDRNGVIASKEFKRVTEPLLKRNSWLDSFTAIPLVFQNESNTLVPDLPSSRMLARAQNDSFVWRNSSNESFSEMTPKTLIDTAKPTQEKLFWRTDNQNLSIPIITLITPIVSCQHLQGQSPSTCNTRQLIATEFNLNAWMSHSIKKINQSNLLINLEINAARQPQVILEWRKDQWRLQTESNSPHFIKAPNYKDGKIPTLNILDGDWVLKIASEDIVSWLLPNLLQIVVLIIGLMIMTLLSAYLHALYQHEVLTEKNQVQLQSEIDAQTSMLRATNDWLLKEIGEREVIQEQLKQKENHLRTLIDNIPNPVWLKTSDGIYLSCNKAIEKMFGLLEVDIIGKKADDFIDEKLAASLHNLERKALESIEAVHDEIWIFLPLYNQYRLIDMIKVALRDEQNKPWSILGISRDITDQFELIDELEKFKRFAEYASEGLGIMTLSATTLYMNPSMNFMLNGNKQTEKYKDNFAHYYPKDIQTQIQDIILPQTLATGHWQGELTALRADGARFSTKETFFVIRDDQGNPLYLGNIMSDITGQKKIEAALQSAKKTAEEATHAKSQFLANMSHEIRTPLNAVLGYSQLLIADKQLSVQQHERLTAISNAGKRLLDLINDILDLSKIEAGALHLRSEYFDLRQEVYDLISLMTSKANAKGLKLSHSIELPNPAIIKSDRQKIGQIILNLVGNAIKFTPSGEVSLAIVYDRQNIYFTITDTGPGITAIEMEQLFMAFKQGDAGKDLGGTGLGLVISKHIAEHLGGELTLESLYETNTKKANGTRANLQLPLTFKAHIALPIVVNKNVKLAANSSCCALVIEDDAASRDVLVHLLRNVGCTVYDASDGEEGLKVALSRTLDIIFTDIRMPVMNGYNMLHALREHIAKETLPVIAVSASNLEHERSFYLTQGFHDFIGKPFQFDDIYSALVNFTNADFTSLDDENTASAEPASDKIDWSNHHEVIKIIQDLKIFRETLHMGDLANSKKIFSQLTAHNLGRTAYQQLHTALRQYDLALAEKAVLNLIDEIETQTNTNNTTNTNTRVE